MLHVCNDVMILSYVPKEEVPNQVILKGSHFLFVFIRPLIYHDGH